MIATDESQFELSDLSFNGLYCGCHFGLRAQRATQAAGWLVRQRSARPDSLQVTASPSSREVVTLSAYSASTMSGKHSVHHGHCGSIAARARPSPSQQSKAVVLDLVNPVRSGRRSLSGARQARLYKVREGTQMPEHAALVDHAAT
jgi:hypothetical protein